ncbi:MAG: tRNA (adenosine(37)-N6)-dimethylallyltransferase MiaA [Bacteroidales bacterium]
MKIDLIVVLGPTASGKTGFAAHLAYEIDGEIISADSRQVYKKMDLGTGKDYEDYIVEGKKIENHLVDIHEPGYKYNVYEFQKDFLNVYYDIHQRNKIPVLCGGTGMYIEAVLKGYKLLPVPPDNDLREELNKHSHERLKEMLYSYNPKLHNTTDLNSKKRILRAIEIAKYYSENSKLDTNYPEIKPVVFGIGFDRLTQRERITDRLKQRLNAGMVEEVEILMSEGVKKDDLLYYGLEYKYIALYVTGELTYYEMFEKLNTAIHQFAKRQMTWFRRMERNGTKINWIDANFTMEEKIEIARKVLDNVN